MNYYVYMTYEPIKASDLGELESLGFIVPFVPEHNDMNVYAYIDVDKSVDAEYVEDRFSLSNTYMEVSQDEVDKHLGKIETVTKVEVGDIVNSHLLRNTPLEVMEVHDDYVVVLLRLRNVSKILKLHPNTVYKTEEVPRYLSEIILTSNTKRLYINSDYTRKGSQRENGSYLNNFRRLVTLKNLFPKRDVVYINPDLEDMELIQDFDLSYCVGNSWEMEIQDDDVLITKYGYVKAKNRFYYKGGTLVEIDVDPDVYLIAKLIYEHKKSAKMGFFSSVANVSLSDLIYSVGRDKKQYLEKYGQKLWFKEYYTGKRVEPKIIQVNTKIQTHKIVMKLKRMGYEYFAYNIDSYVKTIKS